MNVRFSLQRCKVKVIVKISLHVSLITQHFSPLNSLLFLERRKNACILGHHMATSLSQDPPSPPPHVKFPFLINAQREREGSINKVLRGTPLVRRVCHGVASNFNKHSTSQDCFLFPCNFLEFFG